MHPIRITSLDDSRAAEIEGSRVIYGRMTPDKVRFNPFWQQHEHEPAEAAAAWVFRSRVKFRPGATTKATELADHSTSQGDL